MAATTKPTCPCCGASQRYSRAPGEDLAPERLRDALRVCRKCGALYTPAGRSIYLGESYAVVSPYMTDGDLDGAVYYDLLTIGSEGIRRRHGWYDPRTKRILQVG